MTAPDGTRTHPVTDCAANVTTLITIVGATATTYQEANAHLYVGGGRIDPIDVDTDGAVFAADSVALGGIWLGTGAMDFLTAR